MINTEETQRRLNRGRPRKSDIDRRKQCNFALPPDTIAELKRLGVIYGSQANAIVALVKTHAKPRKPPLPQHPR